MAQRKADPKDVEAKPLASLATVAARAGVSKATASRVMTGVPNKMSAATRARVLQAVETLGYRPSRAGSALRQGRSHLVALLVPDPGNAYNAAVAASVERALRAQDKVLVLGNTDEDPAVQDDLLREMRSLAVGGIVMLGAVDSPQLVECQLARIPIVFVNRRSPTRLPGPYVGIDNTHAGRTIAAHFAGRGYRDVVIFHGSFTSSATIGRVDGFREEFARLSTSGARVRLMLVTHDRKRSGYILACTTLGERPVPDAIFCTTDEIAYGAAKFCHERGLRIPADIAIFGFDGNPLNDYLAPWLSTIQVPHDAFGPAAAGILRAQWEHGPGCTPADVVLPFLTVIGQAN